MLYKLESLRGLAALLVVIYHTPYTFFGEKTAFLYSSWLFVDFFFVLSGFVMSLAYRNRIADGLSFTSYIIPRFFRLYPLHLFVILLWIPFIGAKVYLYRSGFGGVDPLLTENGTTLFSSLFMLNSLGVNGWNVASWSISAEWWTYILFFGVCYVLSKSRYYAATILIAAVSTYFVTLLVSGAFVPFTWDYGILRCVPAFLLGAFVFEVYSRVKISSCIQLHELISVALVISAILLCSVNRAFAYLAIAAFMYMIWVYASDKSSVIGVLLETTIARNLGKWSYSIYLTHMLFVVAIADVFEHVLKVPSSSLTAIEAGLVNSMIIALVVIFSRFTYMYIELPGKNLGRVIANKRKLRTELKGV